MTHYLPPRSPASSLLGFRLGTRFKRNMGLMDAFLENRYVSLVPTALTTADRFAGITAALRIKGTLPTPW